MHDDEITMTLKSNFHILGVNLLNLQMMFSIYLLYYLSPMYNVYVSSVHMIASKLVSDFLK